MQYSLNEDLTSWAVAIKLPGRRKGSSALKTTHEDGGVPNHTLHQTRMVGGIGDSDMGKIIHRTLYMSASFVNGKGITWKKTL